jgi:hypothetical protein
MAQVINVTKISASDIQFSEPRKNKNGGGSISFKFKGQACDFRIPQVTFPGGLQVKENPNKDGSSTTSYTISASLNGGDPYGQTTSTDPSETAKLYNFMHALQERVVAEAVEKSVSWFGKKRSEDSLRDSFNKFISLSVDKTPEGWIPNGKYPPSLRLKVPVYDGKVAMDLIDSEDNDVLLTPDTLADVFTKGTSAKFVLQGSIYMVGQSFGVTWKPKHGQVFQRKRQTARDFFKADKEDEEVEVEAEEETKEETVEAEASQQPTPSEPEAEAIPAAAESKPARRRKA